MNATMSILGLYSVNDTLFENLSLPDGMDKDIVVNNILMETAELESLYTDPDALKIFIGMWSSKELPTWQRIYSASILEYNPIENYDRNETTNHTVTLSGSDTVNHDDDETTTSTNSGSDTVSGSSSTTNTGTDTTNTKIAAYDSTTLVNNGEDSTTYGHGISGSSSETTTLGSSNTTSVDRDNTETMSYGKVETTGHTSHIHGNIGVTTSQQMLESELEIAEKINPYDYVVRSFIHRFCLLLY